MKQNPLNMMPNNEWEWQLVPIDSSIGQPDEDLLKFIDSYQTIVDEKYGALLCHFAEALTHPQREIETALGNLVADIVAERSGADVVLFGSGAIRSDSMGPLVTLGDLYKTVPFTDTLQLFTISGANLKRVFRHIMRIENRDGEGECFQVNRGVVAVWDERTQTLESLSARGEPVADAGRYTLLLQGYHYNNSAKNIGLEPSELVMMGPPRLIATSARDVLEEYLRSHQNLKSRVEGRLVYTG